MYLPLGSILAVVIALAISAVTAQDKISSGIAEYEATITAQPEFTSAINFLATGVDRDILASITQNTAYLIPVTATPTWFTVLPTDVREFLESAGSMERAISSSIASQFSASPKRNGCSLAVDKPSSLVLSTLAVVMLGGIFIML